MFSGGAKDALWRKSLKPLMKMSYGTSLTSNDSTPQEEPGCERAALTPYGPARFRYCKHPAGCVRGALAAYIAGISVANVLSGSTTTAVTTGLTANAYQYDVLIVLDVNASAGASPEGYCAPVKSNSTTVIYLDPENPLPAALAVNDDCYVYTFCKGEAAAAGDVRSDLLGVAMCAVTATYWGWFQFDGYCSYAKVEAATTITAEKALIAGTAALSISSTSNPTLFAGCLVQAQAFTNDLVDDVMSGVKLWKLGEGHQISA